MIVEQIESLELEDFEVGELPGSNNFGTVSFDTSKYVAKVSFFVQYKRHINHDPKIYHPYFH